MRFCTFASSSAGNASLLSCGDTHILIDAGISHRRIKCALARLGLTTDALSAIVITHAHTDHIAGLRTFLRHDPPAIYCSDACAPQLRRALPEAAPRLFALGESIRIGGCEVTSIPTSHDAGGSTGYHFACADGRLGYLTDTGILPAGAEKLLGADILLLEANHDIPRLQSGPYPYYLKQRILGPYGRLSNETAALFARDSAAHGTKNIILAHLSDENNTPALALETVGAMLRQHGYTGTLTTAPRDTMAITYFGEEPL